MKKILTIVCALTLIASACGSSGGDTDDETTSDSVASGTEDTTVAAESTTTSEAVETTTTTEAPAETTTTTEAVNGGSEKDPRDFSQAADDPIVELVAQGIIYSQEYDPTNPFKVSEREARCMSQNMVDDLGVEKLALLGLTADSTAGEFDPLDLPVEDREVLANAMIRCVDTEQLFIDQLAPEFPGVDLDDVECMIRNINSDGSLDENLRLALVDPGALDSSMEATFGAKFLRAATDCLEPEELEEFINS